MGFLNRSVELKRLNHLAESGKGELLVVYGRRRIGKTALLLHWLEQNAQRSKGERKAKNAKEAKRAMTAYWVAHKTSSDQLLVSFSRAVAPLLGEKVGAGDVVFPDWEAALSQVFRLGASERLLLVIDEFPYLVEACPELPSLLQKLWDHQGQGSQVVLAICGSQYHMMEDQFFSARQPLYGRATASMRVEEIPRAEVGMFLPRYSESQLAQTLAVIGGVPSYLTMWDDRKPPLRNVEELVLSPGTLFRHEALFLIREELPEPRTYLAILEALGANFMTPTQIAAASGVPRSHVGKYLNTLVRLRFVSRLISVDRQERTGTRTSRYEIRDPYLRFHFAFIYRHPEWMEQGRIGQFRKRIEEQMDAYIGRQVYERWARDRLIAMGDAEALSFVPDEVGRAWTPRLEIDVLAVNWKARCAVVGECKWRSRKMGPAELADLKARAARMERLEGFAFQYALFSKSGFTKPLRELEEPGVLLFEGPGCDLVMQ